MFTDKNKIYEKDIENWLYENPNSVNVDAWIARQLIIPGGRLDLLGITYYTKIDMFYLTLVELKKDGIDSSIITQLARYGKDIEEILNVQYNKDRCDIYCDKIRKVIFCRNTGRLDKQVLQNAMSLDVEILTYDLEVNFELDVRKWGFTKEYKTKVEQEYNKLADSDVFDFMLKRIEEDE